MHSGWRQTWDALGTAWRPLAVFDVLCKLLAVAVYAPLSAWFLRAVLAWSGDVAVSNLDLLSFFLSPQGLLLAALAAVTGFAVLFLELGGLSLIALGANGAQPVSAIRTLWFLAANGRRLCALAVWLLLPLAGLLAATAAVAMAAKAALLSGGDFYFYLQVRPVEFLWAAGIAGSAGALALLAACFLLVRWILAVPVLLLEGREARAAMGQSWSLVREAGTARVALRLLACLAGVTLLSAIAYLLHALLQAGLLRLAGDNVNLVIAAAGLLLAVGLLLGIAVGFLAALAFATQIGGLYATLRPQSRLPEALLRPRRAVQAGRQLRAGTALFGGALALAASAAWLSYAMLDRIRLDHTVAVTAHRGSALVAPENTMAALRQAIADGADYAEIDVQETADGVVVLLHDTDLRRVAGVDRAIWDMSYAELSALDIGGWFSPAFADQRIVTLAQAIAAARGRIGLNIELKITPQNRRLEAEVARIVRQQGCAGGCVVSSLDYRALRNFATLDPATGRGLIVSAQLGDPTRLDVGFLAVNWRMVSRDLVDRAHRAGIEVHVWTVNDPELMLTMIHLGVDNILTSAPELLVALQAERAELSSAAKMLLFAADFLAGLV